MNKILTRKIIRHCSKNLKKSFSTLLVPDTEIKDDMNTGTQFNENLFKDPDYFSVQNLFTIKDLFDARVHFGHKISSLNDKMKPFIFGSRLNHIIFDLNITAQHLIKALNFAAHIAYQDGIILFVSKNSSVTLLVENTALECKEYAVTRQWQMGLFTNSKNVFNCVVRLPDLCILLNTMEENGFQHPAVVEAAKMCIPTIGIVDSNCDPNIITYPVPGNDDSLQSVQLYCNLFKKAILLGKKKREEDMQLNSPKESSEEAPTVENET